MASQDTNIYASIFNY